MAVAASPLLRTPAFSTPEVTLENDQMAADFQRAARSRRAFAPARVLIHAINYAPELIGCAKYTTELAEFLASRGHSVEVVTAPPHYPGWFVREVLSVLVVFAGEDAAGCDYPLPHRHEDERRRDLASAGPAHIRDLRGTHGGVAHLVVPA